MLDWKAVLLLPGIVLAIVLGTFIAEPSGHNTHKESRVIVIGPDSQPTAGGQLGDSITWTVAPPMPTATGVVEEDPTSVPTFPPKGLCHATTNATIACVMPTQESQP